LLFQSISESVDRAAVVRYKAAMPVTHYTEEFRRELLLQFLEAFRKDKRRLVEKLKLAHLSKGTYSRFLNNQESLPSKQSLEAMRAYLEGRPPRYTLVKKDEAYCYSCEQIVASIIMKNRWTCKPCKNEAHNASRLRTNYYARRKPFRYVEVLKPGPARDAFLQYRRRYYLRRNYGKLASCVELVRQINQEIKNVQKENRSIEDVRQWSVHG
jgi:hypothetical protein